MRRCPPLTLYVPGWSTTKIAGIGAALRRTRISLRRNLPARRIAGPAFSAGGWTDLTDLYQDIDISAAATAIDSGQVTYVVSGWLERLSDGSTAATLTYLFFDWSGKQLAPTAQLSSGRSAAIASSRPSTPGHCRPARAA